MTEITLKSGRQDFRVTAVLVTAAICLAVVLVACLSIGPTPIDFVEVLNILLGAEPEIQTANQNIVVMLRGPRIAVAVIVGAALAVSGAAFQGFFRNPLADPTIIGVSAGAATAAVAFIVLGHYLTSNGIALNREFGLPISAVFGAIITVLLISKLARKNGDTHIGMLLLAGIALSGLFSAATGFLVFISDDQQLRELMFWTLGATSRADWNKLLLSAPFLLASTYLLTRQGEVINALTLGEASARHLGFDVQRAKTLIVLLTGCAIGISVALTGVLGFLGLIVPHLARQLIGADNRYVLRLSAFIGAIVLLLADVVARNAVAPAELPVGIVCALIGSPFFLFLLMHRRLNLI